MNRILRPILRVRTSRVCIFLLATFLASISYGQTINNCPNPVTNIVIDSPAAQACTEFFSLDEYPMSPDGEVRWYSTGANMNGSAMGTLPISMFEMNAFSFGISVVNFIVDTGTGTAECSTIVFVSEEANLPTTTCDPITVDLAGQCSGEVTVPYNSVIINTDICDPSAIDSVSLSWTMASMGPPQRTAVVNAHSGNPSFYSLFLRKWVDNMPIREVSCMVEITVINEPAIALVCPASETITVPTGCTAAYAYDVLGASSPPCDEMIVQTLGDPSGTPLSDGTYDYAFEFQDMAGNPTGTDCAWTVTVEESDLAPTQLNCLGAINLSIDQDCQATIDISTILTGNVCIDPTLLELFAVIPGQGEVSGTTLTFTDANVGQTIDVTVRDINGLNSCWGTVTIEDKIGPALNCPADLTISCTMPSDTSAAGAGFPTLVGMGCEDVTIDFMDAVVDNGCRGAFQSIITRTFQATDGAGNIGPACTQVISIERENLLSAVLPPHWDGIDMHTGIQDNGVGSNDPLSCDGAGVVYDTIVRADGRVVPSPFPNGDLIGTGFPGGVGTCGTIFSFYEDIIIDICEEECAQSSPSYKVLRTWEVFDWCTSELLIHQQIIKVVDSIAPVFDIGVPDLTVSTDLWGCGASITLPIVDASDNCSEEIEYSWSVTNGTYDAASNRVFVASPAFTTVGEEIMLIAYAQDCCGNIAADTGFVTIIDQVKPVVVADEHTVVTLNNQSQDGHTKVRAESFDDGSFDGCGPIDFWVRRMDVACVDFDGDPEDEKDEINDWHKEIHFCCMDLDEPQMVVFQVCDDGDRDGVPENNGDDNCNTAMVLVTVQDKLAPTINCPAPREINCIDFIPFVDLLDTELSDDDIALLEVNFGAAFSNSTCGMIDGQTFNSGLDEICGVGSVSRTFTVTTSNGTASCTQTISVVGDEDNLLSCDRIAFPSDSREAQANYDWCDVSDEVAPFVQTIQILECGAVDITEPLIDRDGLCTEVGINLTLDTFNFAGGACVKILAHWEVIDQCFFDENFFIDNEVDPFRSENGYYELYIEYDIFDTDAPELACDDITVETTDCDFNYDTFTISATDDCTSEDLIAITYKVDLGNDGSYDIPVDGSAAEGNAFDAEAIGGLPIGTHAIKWIAYDGCGNYEVCVQEIEVVKQEKAPTPYCHLGLSSAVMDEQYGCSVEFWATDFAVDGFDDCDDSVTVLMIPYQDIYGDPADLDDDLSVEDALAQAMPNWTFGCEYIENGISHVVELRIYFVDEDGVFDFCDASLTINDNFDCCEDLDLGGASMITGNIATEEGEFLEQVTVDIMTDHPEFPRIQSTSDEGTYIFNQLPKSKNYSVSPASNNNAKLGVTTLDIVLIQRHILGLAKLDSPYKIIAADINGNEKVTAADLLQLRKLILGLYEDDSFPSNNAWRFVDNAHQFVDVDRPFPFKEKIDVMNLSQAMYNQNFIGVKIGDVNGSVSAALKGDVSKRSADKTVFLLENQTILEDEISSVNITVADAKTLSGFQMGLEFDASVLSFEGLESGALDINEQHFALKEGKLILSWNALEAISLDEDDVLFSLAFRGVQSGMLADHVKVGESDLSSEAYDAELNVSDLSINFREVTDSKFALLQNSPNPFDGKTLIAFNLPEAGTATLRVFDVSGKVMIEERGDYEKGLNNIVINRNALNTSGIYYYQLIYKDESASKKMILLD